MMNQALRITCTLLFVSSITVAQKLKKADKVIVSNLQAHISFLADDKLEGRRAGTNGEKLAREYISAQFQKSGLQPKGENNNWFQPFEINDGRQVNPATLFLINGHDLKLNDDFSWEIIGRMMSFARKTSNFEVI